MGIKSGLRVLCLLFLYLHTISTKGQCDLQLLDVNFYEGTYTIAFNNTNGCGGSGGPDGVSEIQIGFQALDPDNDCAAMSQGWAFPSGVTTSDDSAHPGWIYSATSAETPLSNWTNLWDDWPWDVDPPYYTGDTITFPLYNQYQQDCSPGAFWADNLTCQLPDALQFWIDEGLSIQAVIWQISYGPTMYADEGGWAEVGPIGDGTTPDCCGIYEDNNFEDNWLIFGPCGEPFPEVIMDTIYVELPCDTTYIELPPDTVTFLEIDTIYITNTEYVVDTVEIETITFIYQIDSVFVTDSVTDTLYVELPPDTITILEVDTLYITQYDTIIQIDTLPVPINWYFYDTTYIYVELPPDTVVETVVETDTLYIESPPDTIIEVEFIFETDTIFETEIIFITDTLYITLTDTIIEYQFIEIDCNTGLPCSDFGFVECDPLTVYIPNTFTPDNDGLNDVWEPVLSPECWSEVEVKIYNRWGNLIWESYDPYNIQWNGSNNGGSYYVPDGVYWWTFKGRKLNSAQIKDLEGHVTIFR